MLVVQGKDNPRLQASGSISQKSCSDLAKRCRQRVDGSDDDSLNTDNFPGVLLLSITATSATGDLDAWQPVCTSHSGRVLQMKT